ncbi:cubilin, partial [Plakobranchus ocellatus]
MEMIWLLCIASPQQGDLRLSRPPSGQGAGGAAQAHDRRVFGDLRASSLSTVPPSPLSIGILLSPFYVEGFDFCYSWQCAHCDQTEISRQLQGKKSGIFQSPGFPSQYPNGVSCTFKFVGMANERVKITFDTFKLQGRSPSCGKDYVHIYSQLEDESEDLLEAKMIGPFCGTQEDNLPKLVVSTGHVLVIWFFADNEKSNKGFNGTWEFISGEIYNMGTEAPSSCGYTIHSAKSSKGFIFSPTYPGMYPDNLFCHYNLIGRKGQRIKLVLEDFWLFYGGEYCPFDYLRIYDGHSTTKPVIATLCGTFNSSTVLYSTTEELRLDFVTGEGRLEVDALPMQANADYSFVRKGFNISYEFSDTFVKLDSDFVREGAQHIRGTECDLRIMSQEESNGTIVSPNYPGLCREGVVCRYYLDGLMDDEHLEKVKVKIYQFEIKGNMPYCLLGFLGEHEDGRLSDGSVKYKFCGSIIPPVLTSQGPRLVITLNTTGAALGGGKFLGRYTFIPDFDIDGEPIEEGKCQFSYRSNKKATGYINSPRHPGEYPINMKCEYIFIPLDDEVIAVTVTSFILSSEKSPPCRSGDSLSFMEDISWPVTHNFTHTQTYCGQMSPGPYVSNRPLKVLFRSDSKDNFVGFKAHYKFVKKRKMANLCRPVTVPGSGSGGTIISPNYPNKYPPLTMCEWVIQASSRSNRILVQIADINIEGKYGREGKRPDCSASALRLYSDSTAIRPVAELCGKAKDSDRDVSFESRYDTFKIAFVASPTSLGDKGFKISWTEIHDTSYSACEGFQCLTNKFCISADLKCNEEPNCGKGDDSDETAESHVWAPIDLGCIPGCVFCSLLLCHSKPTASASKGLGAVR